MRQQIHAVLDPIWKNGGTTRTRLYKMIAKKLGRNEYHTAELRSVAEAEKVYHIVLQLNWDRQ